MKKDISGDHRILTDSRMQSLEIILQGLDYSAGILSDKELNSIGFVDPSDIEFYWGVKYLAIQNYLKYTTNDLCQVFDIKYGKPYRFHYIIDKIPDHEYNMIQLINSCADYFKHKDEKISDHTKKVLADFNLYDEKKQNDDEYYLLTKSLVYLKPTYTIKEILNLLSKWRLKVIEKLNEDSTSEYRQD